MLDTSTCVEFLRDQPPQLVRRVIERSDAIALSTIIAYELFSGAELSARVAYQTSLAESFMQQMTVLDFNMRAAQHAANIRGDLKRKGDMIGNNDILIAGHARSLGLVVVTNNIKDFTRVEGLRCEDWF